jgi:putative ABC transport system substrate-binding protein
MLRIRSIALAFVLLASYAFSTSSVADDTRSRYRIGILRDAFETTAFLRSPNGEVNILERLGYAVGKNIEIERRSAIGSNDGLPKLAAELVSLRVDLIMAIGMGATRAARQATRTIPIVMFVEGDPVAAGLVKTFAKPGGNVTGIMKRTPETNEKRLQLLSEAVPGLKRVGVLWNTSNPENTAEWKALVTSAHALGLELELLAIGFDAEIEPAFDRAIRAGCGALLVPIDRATIQHVARIRDLTIANRIPTIASENSFVSFGVGLMSYGPSGIELSNQFAEYIDKVLKGASPAALPIEQPRRFDLYVSTAFAKAIGVNLPSSLLLQADKVVE